MVELLTILLATSAGSLGGVLGLRVVLAARQIESGQRFRVTFPRGVTADQVTAAVRSLGGLLPSRLYQLVLARSIVLEVIATERGTEHFLIVPSAHARYVVGQWRAAIPGIRLVRDERGAEESRTARELHVVGREALRIEAAVQTSAGLLAALQPIGAGEAVVVQWALSPVEPVPPVLTALTDGRDAHRIPQTRRAAEPSLRAICRVGVRAALPGALLARVIGALHGADTGDRQIKRTMFPSPFVAGRLARRAAPVLTTSLLSADEAGAVLGIPLEGPQLEGLTLTGSRVLPPLPAVAHEGRVLGDALGTSRPLALTESESRKGLLITSPTGAGKSTVLEHLCAADFAAGRGVIAIESKTDLCAALADLVPVSRVGDVLIFDPSDCRPAGFNLLGGGDEAADLITDHVVGQFRRIYQGYLGPRSEFLLRGALLTLSQAEGDWTICEVMALLSDAALRRRLMATISDHALESLWAWFDAQSAAAQQEMVSPLANKLAAFTLRKRLRVVVGQARSAINFDAALRERKIVLVSLSKGLVGEDAASLLGSCLLAELWAAVQRRAAVPAADRHFVSVVLDEAQDFLRLPVALSDAVAQSRGMGVGWTVSHQNLAQLSPDLRAAVLANLRSKLVLQAGAEDARVFAREFAPHVDALDLQGLSAFEGYVALSTGASVAPPASIQTRPPLKPIGLGADVRRRSRDRYGADPETVEKALQARLDAGPIDAPVGARRRR